MCTLVCRHCKNATSCVTFRGECWAGELTASHCVRHDVSFRCRAIASRAGRFTLSLYQPGRAWSGRYGWQRGDALHWRTTVKQCSYITHIPAWRHCVSRSGMLCSMAWHKTAVIYWLCAWYRKRTKGNNILAPNMLRTPGKSRFQNQFRYINLPMDQNCHKMFWVCLAIASVPSTCTILILWM